MDLNTQFFIRLALHAVFILVLVRGLYYHRQRKRDFAFALLMFSFTVFILTYFLKDVEVSLGFTFGLFAVFAMLQYRTDTISPKEMTFLLVAVASAMLNAVTQLGYTSLVGLNALLLALCWFTQSRVFMAEEERHTVDYERLELIHPSRRAELLSDLSERTGLNVYRVELRYLDFLRDTATLRIYYKTPETE